MVVKDDPSFTGNRNFSINMLNVVLGIIGQLCLTILPMYIVLWLKLPIFITLVILGIIIIILKKTWWNRLNAY
jgi:SSS family solute:Na+ symporter